MNIKGKYSIEGKDFDSEADVIRFAELLFAESKAIKDGLHGDWTIYDDYFRGEQWGVGHLSPYKRPKGLSMITANYIWNVLDQINATMNQTPLNIRLLPMSSNNSDKADLFTAAVRGVLERQEFELKTAKTNLDAMRYRSGWFKTWWNPTLYNGWGDVQIDLCDPFRMYPDPSVTELENVGYFFDVVRMPLWEIRRRWPQAGGLVKSDYEPKDADYRSGDKGASDGGIHESGISQVSSVELGVSPPSRTYYYDSAKENAFEMTKGSAQVKFLFVRDSKAYYDVVKGQKNVVKFDIDNLPVLDQGGNFEYEMIDDYESKNTGWKQIIYCNGVLLHYAPYPYLHKELPYTKYSFVEDGTFWGMDFCKQMINIQNTINRFYSNITDYVKRATNPTIILDARCGIDPRSFKPNKFAQILTSNIPVNNAIKEFTLPPLPGDIFVVLENLRHLMESLSAAQEAVQGKRPTGITSGVAIRTLQQAAAARIGLRYMGMKWGAKRVVRQIIALMQQYYLNDRWIRVKDNYGEERPVMINPADMQGEWEVYVSSDMDINTPMEQKFQKMLQFLQIAANMPPDKMPMLKLLADNFGVPEISAAVTQMLNSQSMRDMTMAQQALEMTNAPSAQGDMGGLSANMGQNI